jgi:hypothetical protein
LEDTEHFIKDNSNKKYLYQNKFRLENVLWVGLI